MENRIQKIRHKKMEKQRGRCFYCCQPMWSSDPQAFCQRHGLTVGQARWLRCTAEHVKARQDGGRDNMTNIVAACSFCNDHRHRTKHPLSASSFAAFVRKRLISGRWHKLILAPMPVISPGRSF